MPERVLKLYVHLVHGFRCDFRQRNMQALAHLFQVRLENVDVAVSKEIFLLRIDGGDNDQNAPSVSEGVSV